MEFQKVTIKKSPWVPVTDEEIKKVPKPKKSPHLDVYCRVTLKDGRTGNIVDIDMENGVSLYFVELDDEFKSYLPASDLIWCDEEDFFF